MKQLYVPIALAVMSALVITATPTRRTTRMPTTGAPGRNLNGKMFTLSGNGGKILFYPPGTSPISSYTTRPYSTTSRPYSTTSRPYKTTTTTRPYKTTTTTRPYKTTTRPYSTTTRPYPTTTAPSTPGVSVCLRYLTDTLKLTLSPSTNPLQLRVSAAGSYILDSYRYKRLFFQTDIWFWSNIRRDIWTRVCLTVDNTKKVAQVFSGSNISIRKLLQYDWSGVPVIDIADVEGQVTDLQVWDYPLQKIEVLNYMTRGDVSGPYHGSVLSWSDISYSTSGNTLLEEDDAYRSPPGQPMRSSSGRKRCRQKGEKKSREFLNVVERNREQLK
ncbi:uncharacterized protein LOC115008014 [Cottoperca gobio]|uniref:Uncharacterized protein LOC115008014 n=1 Tax=Cottoperca gobio TaxID=56716 RepID=A0A6J2PLX8_COTGO|nr:uncharacterized protein LOC115008014 [Cottoperca gobio]